MSASTAGAAFRSPQITRLARLLGVDPAAVEGLEGLADDTLRWLHDQASDVIFGHHETRLAGIAHLSNAMPGALAGRLAERFVAPALAARICERLDPSKARELATKVSVGYLADLTMALHPERARAVVQAIPPADIARIAQELFRRGELAALAELASTVTVDGLFAVVGVASARDLLAIVPLVQWTEAFVTVIADVPDTTVDALLREVADAGLWDAGCALLDKLDARALEVTLARARALPEETFAAFRRAADAGLLTPTALHLVERAEDLRGSSS
jgi:muconolactone delta-isomerase